LSRLRRRLLPHQWYFKELIRVSFGFLATYYRLLDVKSLFSSPNNIHAASNAAANANAISTTTAAAYVLISTRLG
jgi:hypothetical protein